LQHNASLGNVTLSNALLGNTSLLTSQLKHFTSYLLNITTTASDWQTPSGQITEDQPEQRIDGYGGKDIEKRKVLR